MRDKKYNKNNIIILEKNKEYFDGIFKELGEEINLDKQQRYAIVSDPKYLLIIAGAGSGKTTTITAKVKYLIEKCGIKEDEILMLSFTNKAVLELKERINISFGLNVKIKTFHSLGFELINMANKTKRIINNSSEILKEIITKNLSLEIRFQFKELILENKFEDVCILFIKLLKTKGNIQDKLNELKISNLNDKKVSEFLLFITKIYYIYEDYLEKNNLLDYDDLILKAINVLDGNIKKIKYKYIIIDEYQDISPVRFQLIKKLQNLTDSKLIVVGDDWQSIFSFSGSTLQIFNEFMKNNDVEIVKITNTYRNSQQLIDIAGKFIMKNKKQIKKRLKSIKKLKNPIEIIYYNDIYNNDDNIAKIILRIISKNVGKFAILSRYSHDLKKLKKEKKFAQIDFLTIHSSKGLGFDNVVIIGLSSEQYGFPSKKENECFLNLLIDQDSLEEERRLFYVALTRTKNKVYILVPKSSPSIFVKEIEKYKNVKIVNKLNKI